MALVVAPPVSPMLAKLARELPVGEQLMYEPKWDGFRCVVFRDGDSVVLGSRNERPLTRYFPDVVSAILANVPDGCVLDGEIVIAGPAGLDFDALLNRIHPADSRVRKLAEETPASFVAFDLLALGPEDYRSRPLRERRRALVDALGDASAPVHVTPASESAEVARDWFSRFEGAGLDGVIAKRLDGAYQEGQRGWTKVKHERTADCVVGAFRWHKSGGKVGSLLLGLYDDSGVLHHVGVTSSFTDARRLELVDELAPYRLESMEGHPWSWGHAADEPDGRRVPGTQSRWNAGRDLSFEPLRIELTCEVGYDHLQGDRFRHATTFHRWRPDRTPESCRYDQLETAVPEELDAVFAAGT
ncbi:MAG: ATP-dependent DNA ligase [Acidimicrobiales bacterium]